MTNLEMLLNEFCGMSELIKYMNANYPGGYVHLSTPVGQYPENGWTIDTLEEECDVNLEHVLAFLGISEKTWGETIAELESEDEGDWDMNAPDGPWTYQPERIEKWW